MKSCPDCNATFRDDYAICPKDGAPLHEITLWQVGTLVRGKYRILARLGEGGMAVVYKARHELLEELRALKVIKADLARDPEFMSRFQNEAIMSRKLTHPNAVRVDDLDIAEDGLPFIAMELVVGDTLKTLLQRTGSLPVSLVLDVTAHVCDALDFAHKQGMVHRDIKPENIVLVAQRSGPPVAKILDFGISRLHEDVAGKKGLTQTGMVIGTPEYMSPEQAMGKRGSELDGRSDLYSLGIVMYRMLTGELPFKAETTVEMILQHLKAPPVAPHLLKPELGIPESVSAIVMKALEKENTKRFASGAEMAAAIKEARGSVTLTSRKIDWAAVSTGTAAFGTEQPAAPPPPATVKDAPAASSVVPPAATPPTTAASTATGTLARDRTPYRKSARIAPPRREFPIRRVLALSGVLVVVASVASWWHFRVSAPRAVPRPLASQHAPVAIKPRPKAAERPAASAMRSAATQQAVPRRKLLTFDEQARVIELNSLAGIYYNEGGCEKALPAYHKVLEIDPENSSAYAAIRRCYSARTSQEPAAPTPAPDTNSPQ